MPDLSPIRFGLHWAGKEAARARAHTPAGSTLRPQVAESLHWDHTRHVFIEGDNLEALKLLRRSLVGQVRLIFIDPPYNTGQSFIYPDRYADGVAEYLVRSGQAAADGSLLEANPETAGRHHTRWLDLMLPRLAVARDLLAANGALFVTIDDHEVHHLRMLLDEVFGRESFVACCAWQKVFAKKNKALISGSHDHVLIYARDIRRWERNLWPRSEDQLAAFRNPDDDPRGRWQSVAYSVPSEDGQRRAAYRYAIETPAGTMVDPPPGRHWNGLPERTADLRADNRLWFGRTGDRRPRLKVFLTEVQGGIVPDTWWSHEHFGHNQEAKKELLTLFEGTEPFTTPKPTRLLRRILQLATHPHQHDIVLDFFAGSATTGHAVWQQNARDGGNRRFILVQLPEPIADPHHPTIAALARARLHRAAATLSGPGDQGFRAYRLAPPSRPRWSGDPDSLDEDLHRAAAPAAFLSPLDFALEAAVDRGIAPHVHLDTVEVAGHTVYLVDHGRLVVCSSPALPDPWPLLDGLVALRQRADLHDAPAVVFREDAFASDTDRLAAMHHLRRLGFAEPGTR